MEPLCRDQLIVSVEPLYRPNDGYDQLVSAGLADVQMNLFIYLQWHPVAMRERLHVSWNMLTHDLKYITAIELSITTS